MNNKIYIAFVLLIALHYTPTVFGQRWKFVYSANTEMGNNDDGNNAGIFQFHYTVTMYRLQNIAVSYASLNELKDNPSGYFSRKDPKDPNLIHGATVSNKPIQMMELVDFDGLTSKNIQDLAVKATDSCEGAKTCWKFSRGFQPWVFLPEEKEIQGLLCQHAKLYYPNGSLMWDLWFAPNFPIDGMPMALYDLTGLMVEGYYAGRRLNIKLLSAEEFAGAIDESIIPECFNQEFKYRGIMKPWTNNKN